MVNACTISNARAVELCSDEKTLKWIKLLDTETFSTILETGGLFWTGDENELKNAVWFTTQKVRYLKGDLTDEQIEKMHEIPEWCWKLTEAEIEYFRECLEVFVKNM